MTAPRKSRRSAANPAAPSPAPGLPGAASWVRDNIPLLGANAVAGGVASLLAIGYCLSFSALLFQGPLSAGLAPGLWAFLVGSAVAGLYVSLTTSLPPAEAAPDNPAVAVLSVLAGTVSGQVLAAGGSGALATDYVLISFSVATLVTGLVMFLLGRLKLVQYIRFVPYPVIGGFLAASGWFLVIGGIELMTGKDISLASLGEPLPRASWPMLGLGAAFAAVVYAVRMRTGNIYVLPVAFLGGSLLIDSVLWAKGLMGPDSGWFVSGPAVLEPWVPLKAALATAVDWGVLLKATTEILAVAGVTVIALLLDVSGLEVARNKSADLDWEFETNGIANIIAAPLGGVMGNLSLNGSRLLEETGGLARMSGVFASLVLVAIVVTGIDLPGLVPRPILAGLLIYLGLVVLTEVLLHSPAQRAWTDYGLALLIAGAIVVEGYLAGVVLGFIGACLMFAVNYSRITVIRRHLTRTVFASNMDRSLAAAKLLAENGDRIHVFWLSGFIFFGSANRVFESIRAAIGAGNGTARRYGVLDLGEVTGFDTTALLSLVKLRNYADDNRVTLALAGAPQQMLAALERMALFGGERRHRAFATRNEALEWCENDILAESGDGARGAAASDLEAWLAREIGGRKAARTLIGYLERRNVAAGSVLYEEGAPSDRIDLVVSGVIDVLVRADAGRSLLLRRMSTHTVVGEMGFFRGTPRTATVAAAEAEALLYTLTREKFDKLKSEEPEVSAAFLQFIIRALADRLEFATRGLAALS